MDMQTWLLYVSVSALAIAVPGPAILYVLSQGLTHGAWRSLTGTLGVMTADAMYLLLSCTGIGAILVASYEVFSVIKWVGACYLVFLGVRAIIAAFRSHESFQLHAVEDTGGRSFINGFVLHAANPKALLYFGTLVPQFIHTDAPFVPQMLLLAITHLAVAFTVMGGYGLMAGRLARYARRPRFARGLNLASGSLLITAGAGMALIRRTTN